MNYKAFIQINFTSLLTVAAPWTTRPKWLPPLGMELKMASNISSLKTLGIRSVNVLILIPFSIQIVFRKAESDTKRKDRLEKVKKSYIPVSELKDDELKVRRAKENAKKRKQRRCKKKVQDAKKDEKLKEKDSNDEKDQISDYEKLRQENIEERNRKMKTFGVKDFFA